MTAEQCLHQGAILSGIARVDMELGHMPQSTKIECEGIDGSKQIVTYDYGQKRVASIPAEDALSLADLALTGDRSSRHALEGRRPSSTLKIQVRRDTLAPA